MLAVVFVLAEGVLPVLVLILMGRGDRGHPGRRGVTGSGPRPGHRLEWALVGAGVLYALFMLRGPVQDVLNAVARGRLAAAMQARLIDAVSAPPGIEHLENPEVLDRLASARGDLMGYQPADAPMTLVGLLGSRLSGVGACLVIGLFRWWLGLILLVVWLVVQRPLMSMVADRGAVYRAASEPLRRSWYLLGLTWRPAPAKEVRVFGLADWLLRGYRGAWLAATTQARQQLQAGAPPAPARCRRAGVRRVRAGRRGDRLGRVPPPRRPAYARHGPADAARHHGGGQHHRRRLQPGADALRAARPRRADR